MKDFKGLLGLVDKLDISLFSCTCDKHPLKTLKMHIIQSIIYDDLGKIEQPSPLKQ